MPYTYDRTRIAAFLIDKVVVDVDVNLYPEKLAWASDGKVVITGTAEFVLPHNKYKSQPYELEASEDGTVSKTTCSDPMHKQLIAMAARDRKRALAELIKDEKERGALRKKP